jgi:hypothetical protein
MSNLLIRAALVPFLISAAVGAEPTPVTACHQQIVGGSGKLTVDLDCSATPLAIGVDVTKGKLYLNGHTITGAEIGVACTERCTIYGPGAITGNGTGVNVYSSKPDAGKVTVADATIDGNATLGIGADKINVTRSTVSGNGGGGIFGGVKATVRGSTVDGNSTYGICSRGKIRLGDTTAQGNGSDPGCAPDSCGGCGDLVSPIKPRVNVRSTCDTSVDPPAATWGLCSND